MDQKWIEYFPEHHQYLGEKLIHHHINHGDLVNGLPDKLHRVDGRSIFHNNFGGKG